MHDKTYVRIAIQLVKAHEGYRKKAYLCPAGKLTIGYGRNLEDNGVSRIEALSMLRNDISNLTSWLPSLFTDFESLSDERKAVLCDMGYNLGIGGLKTFTKFIKAVNEKDFRTAAKEMLDSKWSEQVKDRAKTLADLMKGQRLSDSELL